MSEISRKVGEMEYDGLIADVTPKVQVRGKTIRKMSAETTLTRGTILAMSSGTGGDGKLVVLGTTAGSNETLTPDCILCDDIVVGTSEDVIATVYTAGCFNTAKTIVAEGYTMTSADYDSLRKYGIVFKAASAAN